MIHETPKVTQGQSGKLCKSLIEKGTCSRVNNDICVVEIRINNVVCNLLMKTKTWYQDLKVTEEFWSLFLVSMILGVKEVVLQSRHLLNLNV